ncbi:MAG TPA: hypothetical protein VM899_17180 [Rubellimicrobium sp.]|nr:hypothetical protein [Rubellimicrobium sp.]
MIRLGAVAVAVLAATQAEALTCARPDPIRSFRDAQAAPESYVVLHGTLGFDPAAMPGGGFSPTPEPRPAPVGAVFQGFALGLDGFTRPVEATVTLQPTCAGPWCGSLAPGTYLLFAEVTASGFRVEIGPCGGGAFDGVPEATLGQLAACLRGEACAG